MRTEPGRHRGAGRRAAVLALVLALGCLALLGCTQSALAAAEEGEMLIYMPYGLVHFVRPAEEVDEYLQEINSYDIGQVVFAMPRFKSTGALKVPKHNQEMLALWGSRIAAFNAAHATDLTLTAV